jgi:hypothetical protein
MLRHSMEYIFSLKYAWQSSYWFASLMDVGLAIVRHSLEHAIATSFAA